MITEKQIPLCHAYELGGRTVTELTMRKSTVQDRLDAARTAPDGATQAEMELALFALLCGLPAQDMEQLYDEDYEQIQETYLFLKRQRPDRTGATGKWGAGPDETAGKEPVKSENG
ncbi:phage tail assembly protein [Pseudodesulfovibrio pelocollis]|uniref:phage tail assembly protein n=1 Tax=Pseudodesulfovibrio pelocollis TaxID=3051432 RepID=UPI00255AFD61|nr:phage tail assembly protein [Pseudodesulfovibrio sp. SB368]